MTFRRAAGPRAFVSARQGAPLPHVGTLRSRRACPKPGSWLLLIALIVCSLAPAGLLAQSSAPVRVVASGLTNPRGFTFAENGDIVVASAGESGATAGVTRVGADGCPAPIVEGLPSYRVVFTGPVGVADVAFLDGRLYGLYAGGNIDADGMRNGLYRVDEGGELTLVADVSAFIGDDPVAERPGDYDTDGQPYAMLAMGNAFWATEGNSNQLLRLGLDGRVSRIADLSAGHPIPTGIAPAPDGGVFVGMFTLGPYRDGGAYVVEISPVGTQQVVWTGLTLVTSLAVGPDGALYALQMATGIDPDDPSSIGPGAGRVVRQTGPGTSEEVVTGLNLPVAMEFGPDDALYIAGPAFGGDDGAGTILRFDLAGGVPVALPEPLPTPNVCP